MISIRWHKRAVAQLYQIEDYVLRDFGERVRKEFMEDVKKAVARVAEQPTIGNIDPLFAHKYSLHCGLLGHSQGTQETSKKDTMTVVFYSL